MARVRASLNRRQMLGIAGTLGALALTPRGVLAQSATPMATPTVSGFSSIVDLTHTLTQEFPVFPGGVQAEITVDNTIAENGFYTNLLNLQEHTGTHMDAPAHFVEGGTTADMIPVEQFVAPMAVIDISAKTESDPDSQLTVDDILAWEDANGELPAGAFVAMYSGWESRLSDPASFINLDGDDVQHYPGFDPAAAAFLIEERNIVGIGVDTLSLDFGASQDFGTHITILSAGGYGLENVANLGTLPASGATIIVGGPKHEAASGGPTRAFALL